MIKIAILTMQGAPLLGYLLQELIKRNVSVQSLIYDKKKFSKKDIYIHNQRTGGRLIINDLKNLTNDIDRYDTESHNSNDCLNYIKKNKYDLLINCESPRILNDNIISLANIGILNCHPGALPLYRGCSCVEWAVFNDDPVANTVHFISAGIDEGDIIKSKTVNIKKSDNYIDLRIKVFMEGIILLASVVEDYFLDKKVITIKQDNKIAKYYKPIEKTSLNKVINKLETGNYFYQI